MERPPSNHLKSQTCCLTGHRDLTADEERFLRRTLPAVLLDLIARGYRYFGVGGAVGFDLLAEKTILQLRADHPETRLILVLPCKDQTKFWKTSDIRDYQTILSQADKTVYCAQRYSKDAMLRRNRHLVDHSSVCMAFVKRNSGGAASTVEYARKKGVPVISLYKYAPSRAQ